MTQEAKKIIGTTTTYRGDEHAYLRGYRVRIVAVLKEDLAIRDDATLARAGGVQAADRIEVQPWLEGPQRYSFVTSDPLAKDLGCFATLR